MNVRGGKKNALNFNIIHGQNLILIKDYFLTFVVHGNRLCRSEGYERRPDSRSPGININFPLQYINIRPQSNSGDLQSLSDLDKQTLLTWLADPVKNDRNLNIHHSEISLARSMARQLEGSLRLSQSKSYWIERIQLHELSPRPI